MATPTPNIDWQSDMLVIVLSQLLLVLLSKISELRIILDAKLFHSSQFLLCVCSIRRSPGQEDITVESRMMAASPLYELRRFIRLVYFHISLSHDHKYKCLIHLFKHIRA